MHVTAEQLVHIPRFDAKAVNYKVGKFRWYVLASVARVQYFAIVCLFPVHKQHQNFVNVIEFSAVSAWRNQSHRVEFEEPFTKLWWWIQKYINVPYVNEFALQNLACSHNTIKSHWEYNSLTRLL